MANSRISEVLQHLRGEGLRAGAELTDGQLLDEFIRRRDQKALAALVTRHGPMVWGVCRRVLRNYHDAEDAFQAAFLALVRKATSIVPREMVANWLFGVAHQTALKARATAAKTGSRERQVTEMPEPAMIERDLWNDLQPLLDQELSRLPDKYRVAIVLCDLEGKTRREAARQLGVPDGTLAARLARGRVMLAKRLSRHGMAVSGGSLAVVLAQSAASAGVPSLVLSTAIKSANLFAAGQTAAVPIQVVALTEGVLKAMLLKKLKIACVMLLTLALLTGLGVGAALRTQEAAATEKTQKQAVEPEIPATPTGFLKGNPAPKKAESKLTVIKRPPLLKEPVYQSKEPKYGIIAFGPDVKLHIWLVFDSVPDPLRPGTFKDLLYVDRNGDGDLTDAGERIEAFLDKRPVHYSIAVLKHPQYEKYLEFDVGEVLGHQGLKVNVLWFRGLDRPCIVSLKKRTFTSKVFASKPEDAPVIHIEPMPELEPAVKKAEEKTTAKETVPATADKGDATSTSQWEYKALGQSEIASTDYKKLGYEVGLERGLNELGKQGWELVAFQPPMLDPVTRIERPALYVFKRQKK